MTLGANSLWTLALVILFACCAGVSSRAGTSADNEDAERQPPAPARQAAGGAGATMTGTSPSHGRLNCRRYFGCIPANRPSTGVTRN